MEVSAKSNIDKCVNKAFDELFKEILKEMKGKKAQENKNIGKLRRDT